MNRRWHDISPAVDGTCAWIFSNPEYEKWVQGDGGRLFWIESGPGCGKSTLFKYLRDNHSTMKKDDSGLKTVVLSFFFHAQGVELQKSRLGLFRALLHQLVSKMPYLKASFLEELREESARRQERAERNRQMSRQNTDTENGSVASDYDTAQEEDGEENLNWHFMELKQFLNAFLHKASMTRSIWIFVDAIDECCNETTESIVQLFKTICQDTHANKGGVRICFSSRDYMRFDRTYGLFVNTKGENRNDITAYVQTKLSASEPKIFTEDPNIAGFIAEEASGMFMWAQMITERILKPDFTSKSPDFIRAEIKHYSGRNLESLYGGVLEDMQQDVESLCLMEWLTFCERPLTMDELQWALTLHPDCSGTFKRFADARESSIFRSITGERVYSLSHGLVEYSGDRVRFKHQSMRDFFRGRGLARLRMECGISASISPKKAVSQAHKNLTHVCLAYLKLMNYESSQQSDLFKYKKTMSATTLERSFPLARYSTMYWTTHATQSELPTTQSEHHSKDHLFIKASLGHLPHHLTFWLQCLYTFSNFDDVGEAISAADAGLADRKPELFPRGKTNLVHIAARMGLASLFDTLVQESLRENSLRPTKQRLQNAVLDFNAEDDYGFTVLHLAAVGGNEHIVRQILDGHHFITKPISLRSTMVDFDRRAGTPVVKCPLVMALASGQGGIAQLLLDHGREHGRFDPSKLSFSHGFGFSMFLNGGHAMINMPRYGSSLTTPVRIAQTLVKGASGSSQPKVNEDEGSEAGGFVRRKLRPVGQFLMTDPDAAIGVVFDDVLEGDDVLAPDVPMGNALHLMAMLGEIEMVKVLVASGRVDINATNPFNLTPLAFAASENHNDVVDYLLERGAMSYTSVHYRDTPLFHALNAKTEGGERVLRSLLGVESIPGNSSHLALHLTAATLMGNEKLVESCVTKKSKLLSPFAQSLEGKAWPEDWDECRRLLYEYIRSYEAEWVKDKVNTATDWVKEKRWWNKKKP